MKPRILITGASGLFGSNAMRLSRGRFEALGVYHSHPVKWEGLRTEALNLEDEEAVIQTLDSFRPETIVHAAADSNIDRCEKDHELALRLNVEIPRRLARLSAERGIKLVQFSTDAFFEGTEPFDEDSTPKPMNFYGKTKALAEDAAREASPDHLIVRPNFHGWNAQDKLSLSEWILKGLSTGEELTLFEDVVFSPLYVEPLTEALFHAIETGVTGTLHLAGADPLSKLAFGELIAEVFGLSLSRIRKIRVTDSTLLAKRSKGMVLSTDRLRTVAPHVDLSVRSGIELFKRRLEEGMVSQLKGRPFTLWT